MGGVGGAASPRHLDVQSSRRFHVFPSYPFSFQIVAHSLALFCTLAKLNSIVFKRFRTLRQKTKRRIPPPSLFQESESVPARPRGKEWDLGQKILLKGRPRLDHYKADGGPPLAEERIPCSCFKASSTGAATISRTRSRRAGTSSFVSPLVSMVACR